MSQTGLFIQGLTNPNILFGALTVRYNSKSYTVIVGFDLNIPQVKAGPGSYGRIFQMSELNPAKSVNSSEDDYYAYIFGCD